ncbi:MAG: DUF4349 domain-containing protein [Actinomycetota bacterium]|nr:DUF4349 domain-containing protein [Actinomycetota bacterium]
MEKNALKTKGTKRALMYVGIVVLVVVLLGVIGIFSGEEKNKSSDTTRYMGTEGELAQKGARPTAGNSGENKTFQKSEKNPLLQGESKLVSIRPAMVIKNGDITIEVDKGKFNQKSGEVAMIAEKVGGYVSNSSSHSQDGKITGGTITIRVPGESFQGVFEELKELGEVLSITERAEDVTEEYVDLESRINHLRSQEAFYLSLMAKAKSIEESINIQRELRAVTEELEQLMGRKNFLDNRIWYSTIIVRLQEKGARGKGWGVGEAFMDALHAIVRGFATIIRAIGFVLPYGIVLGIVALIVVLIWRRHSKGEKETR